jgi:hypothetical protein
MARSGTTILHDLLALDPVHRVPQTWEVTRPCPPPESATYESDPRIAEEQGRVEMALKQNPKLATMHPMGAQLPQECGVIRCNNFTSPSLRNMFRVPSYAKWVDGIDYVLVYAAERRQLQLMQWRCKRERWVLKSPQHLATLGALVREFPDAYLIQTHRDPVPAIASLTSLTATLRALVCARVDVREIARDWLDHVPVNLDRSVAWREETGFDRRRVADLPFAELMRDPVAAIERVYGQFGLAWSGALADRLRRFLAEHPSDKHGKHQYSFADTGLSLDEVRERSRRYQEYFGVPSERVR